MDRDAQEQVEGQPAAVVQDRVAAIRIQGRHTMIRDELDVALGEPCQDRLRSLG